MHFCASEIDIIGWMMFISCTVTVCNASTSKSDRSCAYIYYRCRTVVFFSDL